MTAQESNGRIKLTWHQLAWGISVLVALTAGWYDLRTRQIVLQDRIESYMRQADKERNALYIKIENLEQDRRVQRGNG